jgi:hypothetical protein
VNEQTKANLELVNSLMAENASKQAQIIQQGNKAPIPVTIDNYEADSGTVYNGTLFFRRPSSMDYIRMGAIKSELLRTFGIRPIVEYVPVPGGGYERYESLAHVDNSVKYLAQALAACDVLLTGTVPEWFQNHREIEDTDLIVHVYGRFDEELASFRNGTKRGASPDSEASNNSAPMADSQAVRERESEGDRGNTSA